MYLDIKKPFSIEKKECRDIYINEYIKGGNAQGINPYLDDEEYAKMFAENPIIDWNEADNLMDFLEENDYDYDGLIVNEGGTGGYGDEVKDRGYAYVIFRPEQAKLTSDRNPLPKKEFRTEEIVKTEAPRYRYYSTQRPIDIGTIPKSANAHITNYSDKVMVDEIGRQAYGYVEYDMPLTEKEINAYELYAATKNESFIDNVTLAEAGIRPLNDDECYVYIVRRKSNGRFLTDWTQNLSEQLKQLKDKDKVLGCFVVPNRMTAMHFKNALSKMSHFDIETLLLYPDRMKDMYTGYKSVENVDVKQLNEALNLDAMPVKRAFQFMPSENDLTNEIYNRTVVKLAEDMQKSYLEDVDVRKDTLMGMANNILLERVPVIDMALENGFSQKEVEKLMDIDVSKSDFLKYSMQQAQSIVTNGIDTIVEDEEKRLIPAGAFEDIVIDADSSVDYYKQGLKGHYFMQVTDANKVATLYTLENFSVLPYVSQLIVDGYDSERTEELIEKFVGLDERIEDDVLAENIVAFIRDINGQTVDKEQVATMLLQADSEGLYKLLDNHKSNGNERNLDEVIKRNQLKGLIKHNAKAFDRKNLEQFIARAKDDIHILETMPEYITENIENLRMITENIAGSLQYLPQIAKSDMQCVINAVEKKGQDYIYADAELRKNEEVIKAALRNDRSVVAYISENTLDKMSLKSRIHVDALTKLSVEDCLAVYSYVVDNICVKEIGNYFDKYKDEDSRDRMYSSIEDKWDKEDKAIVKEAKTAILKLRVTKENADLAGLSLEELKSMGVTPDISNYEIVYIKDGCVKSRGDISGLFRMVNGEEKPKNFYENAMEIGDIVVTTNNGYDFQSYFVDMNNEKLDKEFLNLLTVRKINDNFDVRVERDILKRFEEINVLDGKTKERLEMLDTLYSEHILNASERAGAVKEENAFELTQEEKDGLRKTEIAETRQNIIPKDRMTYKKEDGEVILKKDAVKNKEEFIQRTDEINRKEVTIRNLSHTYAIESSEDFAEMLNEYPVEDIKDGTNYRLVQIDNISGNIVKVNDLLFSSREIAEQFFDDEINNPHTSKGNNVLVGYEALVNKSLEVAGIRKENELLQGIQNVMDSEKFKGWCVARANQFHKKYSLNNVLSIFLQNPDASIVYGAREWQEYGRQVKKGEKALRITVPAKTAFQKQNGGLMNVIAKSIREQIENGKEAGVYRLGDSNLTFIGNKTGLYSLLINDRVLLSNVDAKTLSHYIDINIIGKTPVAFTSVNVFDITQVEEPEYLSIRNLKEEDKKDLMVDEKGKPQKTRTGAYKVKNTVARREKLNPTLDTHIEDAKELNVDEIYKSLQLISERNGVPVSEAKVSEEKGASGYYSRTENKIVIDSELSPTEKIAVCVHEIAHSRMHKNGANMPRRLKEVQAETVSYIVNKSLGIDTQTSSFNYIANWMGSRRMSEIKQSLELINSQATALHDDIINDLNERGVCLKLAEFSKERLAENEKDISKEQARQVWLDELQGYSVTCMELGEHVRLKAAEIKKSIANESDKDIVSLQMTILDTYDAISKETQEIKQTIENAKAEVSVGKLDGKSFEQYRQHIEKALDRVEIGKNEIKKCKEHIADVKKEKGAEFEAKMLPIDSFKAKFRENSLDAIISLKDEYTQIADLDSRQIQFLAISPFIKDAMERTNDIKAFVDVCSMELKNVEMVKSDSGVFVEVVASEYKDLQTGSLMHMATANRIIEIVEKGMREERKEARRDKTLIPCVAVETNVYGISPNGNLISLSGLTLNLGNGRQDDLLSAIEQRTRDYGKYSEFTQQCRKACKERKFERERQTPPVPNISNVIAHNDFLREQRISKEKKEEEELKEVENHAVLEWEHLSTGKMEKEANKENKRSGEKER